MSKWKPKSFPKSSNITKIQFLKISSLNQSFSLEFQLPIHYPDMRIGGLFTELELLSNRLVHLSLLGLYTSYQELELFDIQKLANSCNFPPRLSLDAVPYNMNKILRLIGPYVEKSEKILGIFL